MTASVPSPAPTLASTRDRTHLRVHPERSAPDEVAYDVVVPEGSLWVPGDNRDHSRDSRYNMEQPSGGFVPIDNVVGPR